MDSIPNSLNVTHKNVWLTVGRITNEILSERVKESKDCLSLSLRIFMFLSQEKV